MKLYKQKATGTVSTEEIWRYIFDRNPFMQSFDEQVANGYLIEIRDIEDDNK